MALGMNYADYSNNPSNYFARHMVSRNLPTLISYIQNQRGPLLDNNLGKINQGYTSS